MDCSRLFRAAVIGVILAAPAVAQDTAVCVCTPQHTHIPSEFERRSAFNISFVQTRLLRTEWEY